ncbi:hypothetical protein BC828DRAFT_66338 [Blastocladiella britannica]|nr:hypothetical protein BC828DRAFT_66338 [Blastocladiella britannica]
MDSSSEVVADDPVRAIVAVLISRDAFIFAPLVWLACIGTAWALQQLKYAVDAHHTHGYDPLAREEEEDARDLDQDQDELEQPIEFVVPTVVESIAGALQSVAMAALAGWMLVSTIATRDAATSASWPVVASLSAWPILSVLAAIDVIRRRRPCSTRSPPRYLHISRGLVIGGFLGFSLNALIYCALEDPHPTHPLVSALDAHAMLCIKLVGLIVLLHGFSRRSSYVDYPGVPRFRSASAWEGLTLRWMWPTILTAFRVNRLEVDDCADYLPEDVPSHVFSQYLEYRTQGMTIGRAAFTVVRRDVAFCLVLSFSYIWCGFLPPFAMNKLLNYLDAREATDPTAYPYSTSFATGYAFCFLLLACQTIRVLVESHAYQWARITAFRVQSLLNSAIAYALLESTRPPPNAVNLAAGDARKFGMGMFGGLAWAFVPLRIVLAIAALVELLGWRPVAAGTGLIAIALPLNVWVAQRVKMDQKTSLTWTDGRLDVSAQTFEAIRLIKTQVWETHFFGKIDEKRNVELRFIFRYLMWSSIMTLLSVVTPMAVTVTSFVAYEWFPRNGAPNLSPAQVFTALYLFSMLDWPLRRMPEMFARVWVVGKVAWERIYAFLEACEQNPRTHRELAVSPPRLELVDIEVPRSNGFTLSGTMEFPIGKLTVVVGPLGSGKTSLLQTLLGELPMTQGTIYIPSFQTALVEQSVFLLHATIRDNILFGQPWNSRRYQRVLEQADLLPDLAQLPDRDLTRLGDRGIGLSGGQRQRIALCRALYSDAPVILADDVLSAVDPTTANHIYSQALVAAAHEDGKTVVLVSHAVSLATRDADWVICLHNGKVTGQGAVSEMMPVLVPMVGEVERSLQQQQEKQRVPGKLSRPGSSQGHPRVSALQQQPQVRLVKVSSETMSERGGANAARDTEEARSEGAVMWDHYLRYLRAFGPVAGTVALTLLLALQFAQLRADLYLKDWSGGLRSASQALMLFAIFKSAAGAFLCASLLMLFLGSFRASQILHRDLLGHLLALPITWFDTHPLGNILNRLSKDLSSVDTTLVTNFKDFVQSSLSCVSSLSAVVLASPQLLAVCAPFVLIYGALSRGYLRTARDVRRMTNTMYSPVVQSITEFSHGGACVRAYGKVPYFIHRFNTTRLHDAIRPHLSICTSNRWLMVVGDFAAAVLCFSVAVGFLLMSHAPSTPSPADGGGGPSAAAGHAAWAGFALHYCLILSETIRQLMNDYSLVEVDMSSVERLGEYLALPAESQAGIQEMPGWPVAGPIVVDDMCMAYKRRAGSLLGSSSLVGGGSDAEAAADEWQLILRNVSFKVPCGARVAVLGRTGSGKSSCVAALLRMAPFVGGTISITNVPHRDLHPHYLRSQFGVVNQETHLFKGSLRENLDPVGQVDDAALNALLTRFHAQLPFSLDYRIESAKTLSKGQAQLIGLLRSLASAKAKRVKMFLWFRRADFGHGSGLGPTVLGRVP